METVVSKNGWTLIKYVSSTGITSLTIDRPSDVSGIDVFFNTCHFENKRMIVDNLQVHIESYVFEDLGYFREFIEELQKADEFAAEVYKYCVKNGFWKI